MEKLKFKVLSYLRDHNVMTMATTGQEGLWASALFYVNDGFTFYFLSAPTTRHIININRNPGTAVTIQEDYQEWSQIKGVQLEGKASRIEEAEQKQVIQLYNRKFPIIGKTDGHSQAPSEIAKAMSKIAWYQIVPEHLYFIDNSLGLGHRDKIALS